MVQTITQIPTQGLFQPKYIRNSEVSLGCSITGEPDWFDKSTFKSMSIFLGILANRNFFRTAKGEG